VKKDLGLSRRRGIKGRGIRGIKSSNIPVLPIFQKGYFKTKPLFIDSITN
jgi:hypothetical protein